MLCIKCIKARGNNTIGNVITFLSFHSLYLQSTDDDDDDDDFNFLTELYTSMLMRINYLSSVTIKYEGKICG